MRQKMSYPEALLWRDLKGEQLGYRFTRQKVLCQGRYIADFYCAKARMIVEVDGKQHLEQDMMLADKVRDVEIYEKHGLATLRLPAREVLGMRDYAVHKIKLYCDARTK